MRENGIIWDSGSSFTKQFEGYVTQRTENPIISFGELPFSTTDINPLAGDCFSHRIPRNDPNLSRS